MRRWNYYHRSHAWRRPRCSETTSLWVYDLSPYYFYESICIVELYASLISFQFRVFYDKCLFLFLTIKAFYFDTEFHVIIQFSIFYEDSFLYQIVARSIKYWNPWPYILCNFGIAYLYCCSFFVFFAKSSHNIRKQDENCRAAVNYAAVIDKRVVNKETLRIVENEPCS